MILRNTVLLLSRNWKFFKFTKPLSNMSKKLAAFDFDSTICNENSDIIVRNLLPSDVVAQYETHEKYDKNGWTRYMQGIFQLLHSNNINESIITKSVIAIPPIDGMVQLLQQLKEFNFDIIIISDANSFFIRKWLEEHELLNYVKEIFTNPAEFVDGLLKINMYHVQNTCTLSTINLCKGKILEEFIEKQKLLGEHYEQIIYVGDGANDICPMLRLNIGDLAFCRSGFKCAKIAQSILSGQPYNNETYHMKANVCNWIDGFDILKAITQPPEL